MFFLAPETEQQLDPQIEAQAVEQKHSQAMQQQEAKQEVVKAEITEQEITQAENISNTEKSENGQMPQQILALQPQILEGEWTVDKWEFWFRNSSLSPAVQELAQHGLMSGMIDGQSTFQISKQYENLLNQTQHDLEASLKQQWSKTVFTVQYGEVETTTPFMMQQQRKVRAFDRATEMLQQEPVVKGLLEAFDGQLQNIQLKS